MRVVLINLSDGTYRGSRSRLNASAKKYAITEISSYDFEDIKGTSFYLGHKHILDKPTGTGYWLWKPYIILESLKKLGEGDIVIYSDSGIEIMGYLDPLIITCAEQQPILLFANGNFTNNLWIKRDCFVLMDCDDESCWTAQHCDASFLLCRKSDETMKFLQQWLDYACDERILTDMPNTCGKDNLPGFIEHRRDQAILSLLAHKYNITLFRMPSQFGNHYKAPAYRVKGEFNCVNQLNQRRVKYYARKPYYNSPYGQLLNHHRSKDNGHVPAPPPGITERIINKIKKGLKK